MEIEQNTEKDRYFSIYKSFTSKAIKGGFPITYITKEKHRKKGILTYSNYSIQLWKKIEEKKKISKKIIFESSNSEKANSEINIEKIKSKKTSHIFNSRKNSEMKNSEIKSGKNLEEMNIEKIELEKNSEILNSKKNSEMKNSKKNSEMKNSEIKSEKNSEKKSEINSRKNSEMKNSEEMDLEENMIGEKTEKSNFEKNSFEDKKLLWSFENVKIKIITIKSLFKQENVTNSNVIIILNSEMNLEIFSIFEETCKKITHVNTDIDTKKKNYENLTKLEINKKGTICVISDFDKEFWVVNLSHKKKNLKIKKIYNFYFFKKILDFFFIEDTLAILEEFNFQQALSFLNFEIENETVEVSKNLEILEFSDLSKNENLQNMNVYNVFDLFVNNYICYFLVEGGFFFYDLKKNALKGFLEIDIIDGKIFSENYFDNIFYFFVKNLNSEKLKVLEINLRGQFDLLNIVENVNINFKGEIDFCNNLIKLEGFKFLALTERRNTFYYDFTKSRANLDNFENCLDKGYFKKRVFYKNMKIDEIVEFRENSIFFDKFYGKLDFVCRGVKTVFESFQNNIFEETKNFEIFFEDDKKILILNLFRGFAIMELNSDFKNGEIIFIYRQNKKVLDILLCEKTVFLICENNILGFDLKNFEKKIYKSFENKKIIKVEKSENNLLYILDNENNLSIIKFEKENFEEQLSKKINSKIHLLKIINSKVYIHNYFETRIFISDEKLEKTKEIQISNKNLNDLEILKTEEDIFLFLGFRDGHLEIKNSKYDTIFNFTIDSFPLSFFVVSISKKNKIFILGKKMKIFDIKTKKQKLIDLEYVKKIIKLDDSKIIALQKNLISFHKFDKNETRNEELIKTPILENIFKIKKIFIKENHLLSLFKKKDDINLYLNIYDLELNKKIGEKFIGDFESLDILGFCYKTENLIIFSIAKKKKYFYGIARYFPKSGKIDDFNLTRFSSKIEKMYYSQIHNFIIFENTEYLIINNIIASRSRRIKKSEKKNLIELKKNAQIESTTKKSNLLLKSDILAFITIFNEILFFSYEKKFQKFINRGTHLDREEIFFIDMIDLDKFIISTLKSIKILKFNCDKNVENYYKMDLIGKIDFFVPLVYMNFEKNYFVSENDDIFLFFEIGNEEFNFFKLLEKIIYDKKNNKSIYYKGRSFVKMLNLKEKLENNRIDFDKVFENDFIIESRKMKFKIIDIEFKKDDNIYELIECFKKENLYKKWFPENIVKKCERILFND